MCFGVWGQSGMWGLLLNTHSSVNVGESPLLVLPTYPLAESSPDTGSRVLAWGLKPM